MAKNKRADRVWDRLIQSYGTRIAEMYGIEIPKPWVDAIDDLSDEQIAYGLKAILRESPIHPPALGQFIACCKNLPVAPTNSGPSLQEQLLEYAAIKYRTQLSALEYSRPWNYVYREWRDETRPKGLERCAQCVGVYIDLDDGSRIAVSVTDMLGDADGHTKAMRMFRPGPPPTDAQMAAYRANMPDLTR